ncbi:MAG: nucleotide-binding protein [Verrucomicrobiales bacterium]|nr:nucleotide-binding protein [Verrucomicrobiales bacterium]
METEIRQLVCRSILLECFRLVREDLRSRVQALSGEVSHRREVIQDHYSRFGAISNALVNLRNGKLEFDKGQETDDAIRNLVDCVNEIGRTIRNGLVEPLRGMMASAPENNQDGCPTELALQNLIRSKPWVPAIEMAEGAFATIAPARRVAADNLRLLGMPPVHLGNPAKVFIASTTEGLGLANLIDSEISRLLGDQVSSTVWNVSPEFRPGASNLASLEAVVRNYRVGVAVISPHDRFDRVRENGDLPIGNVLLEHGMFLGKHGGLRAVLVLPGAGIPGLSDLDGIGSARYDASLPPEEIAKVVAAKIAQVIRQELES